MGVRCSNCGSELEPGAKYCNVCGFFNVPDYGSVEVEESTIFKDVSPEEAQTFVAPDNPNKAKKKIGVAHIMAALFVLLALFAIAVIYPQVRRIQEIAMMEAVTDEAEYSFGFDVEGDPGEKLMLVDGVIYNDKGGKITGIYARESRVGDFYINEDQTAGVLYDSRKTCLYITADMKVKALADDVYDAGLSYSGDYVFYKKVKDSYNKFLFMYEVETGLESMIAEADTSDVVMSPSGEYIAYITHDKSSYKKKYLNINGWEKNATVLDENVYEIFAVSDDGRMVVYSTVDPDTYERMLVCWNDGKIVELTDQYVSTMFFNRDCSQFIGLTDDNAFYFESGMSGVRELFDQRPYGIVIDGHRRRISPKNSNTFVYSLDNLKGTFLKTRDGIYILDESMEPLPVMGKPLNITLVRRFDDKDIIVFYDGSEIVYNTVGFDGTIDVTYPVGEAEMGGFAMNEDGSILWYYDETAEKVYKVNVKKGKKKSVFGKVIKKGSKSLMWDPYTQRCFFISEDGRSLGVSEDGDIKEYATDCAEAYTSFKYEDLVGYTGKSYENYKYVLVFGRYVELWD